jgi:serpin B
MLRQGLAVVAVALAMTAIGCKSSRRDLALAPHQPPATATPVTPPTPLVAADNRFGFALLAKLLASQPRGNVFISPSSIAIALDMALSGAAGETKEAMMKTLSLEGLTPADVNQANVGLRRGLANPGESVELDIANSLWLSKAYDFVPGFLQCGETYYGAHLERVDFTRDDAKRKINDWVNQSTHGKIRDIIEGPPEPNMAVVIVNAVYFAGRWSHSFQKAETKPGPFTFQDGTTKQIPRMTQDRKFDYQESPSFQAIRLPYGDERLAMYVFLPAKSSSIAAFCKTLTAENWGKWLRTFGEKEGTIALPRFRAGYGVRLNDALKAMGMGVAFNNGGANFSGICKGGSIWIDRVVHKAVVEVDEEGTKASAATMAGMEAKGVPETPFNMVVDRPFFCAIVDSATNSILFMGAIVSPGAAGG